MKEEEKIKKKKVFLLIFAALAFLLIYFVSIQPSNDRVWKEGHGILAYSEISDNEVKIHNIRQLNYDETGNYTASYYSKTYNLDELEEVWFFVEPFAKWEGVAHTFLTFEFKDGEYLSVSVESRKEKGEDYTGFKGLFKNYEIFYVIVEEKNIIFSIIDYRADTLYLYPINTTSEKKKALFLDIASGMNDLKENPEFYNTITNTCTTKLRDHVNSITPGRFKFYNIAAHLPGFSDRTLYYMNLINTTLPYEEIEACYRIDEVAKEVRHDPNFSEKIREFCHN